MVVNEPINKAGGDITEATSQKPCYLLELPPELREEIYKLCLKVDDYNIELEDQPVPRFFTGVHINKSWKNRHPLPPLLQTNSLIRKEAGPTWLKINRFLVYIYDLDAHLLSQWTDFCSSLMKPSATVTYGCAHCPELEIFSARMGHPYVWDNVLQWCKWVHQGKLEPPRPSEVHYPGSSLAAGALGIARSHRGRPWDECEASLSCLRLVLEGGDDPVEIR